MKKSQQVRELIAAAKAAGQTQDSIIGAVMALDMQRQLARAYIKNNWDKVKVETTEQATAETSTDEQTRAAETVAEVTELTPEQKLAIKRERDAQRKREKRAAAKAALAAAPEAAM